jgi:DNA-binding transcriptional LysR family regulator
MRSRLSQLSCLMAVAEEGQISRAARKLNVTQASLSRSLAQLESELGVQLLVRGPRGVSLTPAGAAFTAKARRALDAESEASETAAALARGARGTLLVGFVGPPPAVSFPQLFASFAANGEAGVAFQDVPFPRGTTAEWLAGIDLGVCVQPRAEEGICAMPLRVEPRAAVVRAGHPLASRERVELADVLDLHFIGYHPLVQAEWAGFHSLDDHRGGPPRVLTEDAVSTSLQMAATIGTTEAITTAPYSDAHTAQMLLGTVVALAIDDAAPATVCMVWRSENINPLLAELVGAARELQEAGELGI